MRLLFVTANAYLPQLRGGMQSSSRELCCALKGRGHHVAVLSGFTGGDLLAWMCEIQKQIQHRNVSRDGVMGYPVWRSRCPWKALDYVAKKEKPDVIVVMAVEPVPMALAALETRIPVLMQLQDVEFGQHGGRFEDLGNGVRFAANSHFTAERYRRVYCINPSVIYPFIAFDNYRTKTTSENVTFINPYPVKGSDIALQVARLCPEIPFTFVESWALTPLYRRSLMERINAVPNVTLLASQEDMRKVYSKSKILLVPSVWEEGYGRVANEAQISGIPVVASKRGGLPEAVGRGGILLDPAGPIDQWVDAVRQLWFDDRRYAELSEAAVANAERPENSVSRKLELWEQTLLDTAASGSAASISDPVAPSAA
jgi:glycosyltransferase involved in cell wall biosynthesis